MSAAKNLVPENKYDLRAVKNLQKADYASIVPLLDQLLFWIADGNWPVARPMADFLAALGEPIVPAVRRVFNGNDTIHKYYCLLMIVPQLRPEALNCLIQDLERLAFNPCADEIAEEVTQLAQETLESLPKTV